MNISTPSQTSSGSQMHSDKILGRQRWSQIKSPQPEDPSPLLVVLVSPNTSNNRLGRQSPHQGCWRVSELSRCPDSSQNPQADCSVVPDPRSHLASCSVWYCCSGGCSRGNLKLHLRLHESSQSLKCHHLSDPGFMGNLPISFRDTTYRYSLRSHERKTKTKKVERMLGGELKMWGTEHLLLHTTKILQQHREYEDAAYIHCLDSAGCFVLNFPADPAASW